MHRIITALIAFACCADGLAAPVCGAGLRGAQTIKSGHYLLAYRTQPAKIVVGKHFSIELVTCSVSGAPAPDGIAVDAYMPEHGHGMNYKAIVKPAGNARYRADGLMFHMPGRWDLTFELRAAGKTERLTRSIVIE